MKAKRNITAALSTVAAIATLTSASAQVSQDFVHGKTPF
jgi:hypothetical protein